MPYTRAYSTDPRFTCYIVIRSSFALAKAFIYYFSVYFLYFRIVKNSNIDISLCEHMLFHISKLHIAYVCTIIFLVLLVFARILRLYPVLCNLSAHQLNYSTIQYVCPFFFHYKTYLKTVRYDPNDRNILVGTYEISVENFSEMTPMRLACEKRIAQKKTKIEGIKTPTKDFHRTSLAHLMKTCCIFTFFCVFYC